MGPPSFVQDSFVIQVHTARSPTVESPLAHETMQLLSSALSMHTFKRYSESTFGEHGKGLQTGCVPGTTPPGWQENVGCVSPTPSTWPGAPRAVLVSPFRNCVRYSGLKMCKRLSLDSQKKICGKVHRVAVPRHTTDRAELAYKLAGAILLGHLHGFWCDTHAFIEGSRLGTASTTQGACGCTLFSPV